MGRGGRERGRRGDEEESGGSGVGVEREGGGRRECACV